MYFFANIFFILKDAKKYKFSLQQSICAQLGSKLAEPRSRQEASFLISHSQTLGNMYIHTQAHTHARIKRAGGLCPFSLYINLLKKTSI